MKKLFTLLLIVSMAFVSFAQRTVGEEIEFDFTKIRAEVGDTIWPGNLVNATGWSVYSWSEGNGHILGINNYGDQGYGQVVEFAADEEPYAIGSAIYWIGARTGGFADVVFTVWDYSTGEVGEVLGSKTIEMSEVEASTNFAGAFTVTFDQPINVTGDYVIGVDLSDLAEWEDEVYEFANVSSKSGDGNEAGLALVKEADGVWGPVLDHGVDFDIAIFPIVSEPASAGLLNNFTVNAYPNPFTNEITISNAKVERVVIYNLIGQEVMNVRVNGNKVITSDLSSGVYVVSFEGNGERAIRKMIKQ
ncbi:MAG TPA: hypothetical protein DG754_11250 [Bacteroidales bacterium]|jgi:hypothetical protein|nr:hypothetical protein [Bacteroidales bacterium]